MIRRWLMLAALAICATPTAAQLQYSTELNLASSYTSRGLTFTNRPVLQPSAERRATRGASALLFSLWANIEPVAYEDAHHLSARDGLPGTSEVDITLELAHAFGPLELGVGTIAFLYPRHERNDPNEGGSHTVEATFRATLDVPLSPQFDIYYDAIAAPGIYARLGVSHELSGRAPLELDAALGYSYGQADRDDPDWYYNADGLTHAEFGAALPLPAGRIVISPSLRGILALDDETRVTSPMSKRTFKLLAGIAVSWSGSRP